MKFKIIYTLHIADEHLTECDRETLEQSQEAFIQMSNIYGITARMSDRGILHEAARKRVVDCLLQYGSLYAASKLSIFCMTMLWKNSVKV